MKPFNLERALAGDSIVTRNGSKVTEFHHFKTASDHSESVVAIIEGSIRTFDKNGRFQITDSPYDLFMAPQKVVGWINLYPGEHGIPFKTGEVSMTQRFADEIALGNRIACVPIEVEI